MPMGHIHIPPCANARIHLFENRIRYYGIKSMTHDNDTDSDITFSHSQWHFISLVELY